MLKPLWAYSLKHSLPPSNPPCSVAILGKDPQIVETEILPTGPALLQLRHSSFCYNSRALSSQKTKLLNVIRQGAWWPLGIPNK